MSLAEGLLLDGLYDTVVSQDVFVAIRSDTAPGAGTFLDPYRGNSAADFDKVLRAVCKNDAVKEVITTVRLGPGTFVTNGTGDAWPNPTSGFFLNKRVRIVGSGRDVTTVQLATAGANVFAGPADTQLVGVEIQDLCVDVARKGGAIKLSGENIFARNLRIINFLPDTSVSRVIVQLADSASGRIARNCILENCIFDTPGTIVGGTTPSATLVKFAGASQSAPHQFCVVRQCLFNGVLVTDDLIAIDAGLGRGFIAEENQCFNLKTGVRLLDQAAIDLIIWNNEFNVVQNGIWLTHTDGTTPVGRVVIIENAFNLARGLGATTAAIAITGDANERNFAQVVIRKCVIAADPESGGSTSFLNGINITNVTDAVAENNVIDDCANGAAGPLSFDKYTNFKSFNNQTTAGVLLRAYDKANSRYRMELQDFTEDALIGF